MARAESQPDASRRRTPVVVGVGRIVVYVLLALAAAIAVWALTDGADRDLWSNPAAFVQAVAALVPAS